MDTQRLCELTSAAYSLKLRPLVDLTCCALPRIIEGRSPEEIRDIFHLPDDLTEEEKLESLRNFIDDPRIRRLNRLYAKKRKELKERDKLKDVEVEEEHGDERSVDDLLSFINGGGKVCIADSKRGRANNKNKKKNRRRKEQANPLNDSNNGSIDRTLSPTPSQTSNLLDFKDFEFDDSDDDGLDPSLKEQIDS